VECCPTLQWLCEAVGHWWELEHAVVHIDPEHPKHAQWATCLVSMQAMEELGLSWFHLSPGGGRNRPRDIKDAQVGPIYSL
jgi:hypothetical protein